MPYCQLNCCTTVQKLPLKKLAVALKVGNYFRRLVSTELYHKLMQNQQNFTKCTGSISSQVLPGKDIILLKLTANFRMDL